MSELAIIRPFFKGSRTDCGWLDTSLSEYAIYLLSNMAVGRIRQAMGENSRLERNNGLSMLQGILNRGMNAQSSFRHR